MKTAIVYLLCIVAFCFIPIMQSSAQEKFPKHASTPSLPGQSLSDRAARYKIPGKKVSQYTAQDWGAWIDSTWGPGAPTATKLQIFDDFWSLIDKQYGGFPNLDVNWDSLKALYRPEIEAGVSRGRLWGILGQMYLALQEIHTWIYDAGLDSAFMEGGRFVYKPGIPAFFPSGWGWSGSFGAALTPLPDSSLLVYRALTPHPLGIVPGDVVLGYDRLPWKRLYQELLSAGLPLEWWSETRWGSSRRSMTHALLNSAGNNWGLFDTVDVVKYATGDTVHLPTASLIGLDYLSLFATEQVPVPGVGMPNYRDGEQASWGVVDNTSVGYVYVYSWDSGVSPVFEAAMRDLITVKKVTGLILDFRYNRGSVDSWTAANAGLDYLFAVDPCGPSRWRAATRLDPANHFSFSFSPDPAVFSPRPDYYDRPVAVLTGPQAWSVGDHTAFRMRFHPMARFFGLPTNGAFVFGSTVAGPVWGTWYYSCAAGQMLSLVNNEGFLMHKGFAVDEEVWLTRDGVAKGEDDVVKRALEWITTLTYAHDVGLDRHYARPGKDSVCITAVMANPLHHTASVSAIITDALGNVRDSVLLQNDGLHGDASAGDSVWGCRIGAPSDEGLFTVSVRSDDATQGTFRRLPNTTAFATCGPLTVDSVTIGHSHMFYAVTPTVKNNGLTSSIIGASVTLVSNDPSVTIQGLPILLPEILPGESANTLGTFLLSYNPSTFPGYFDLKFDLAINGYVCWTDSVKVFTTGVTSQPQLPTVYVLHQNYPNPFNPSTTIRFDIPQRSRVRLTIFNILGQQVADLANEEMSAGYFERTWNAKVASGMYFYRIDAAAVDNPNKRFVDVKKMILLR